LTSIKASFFVTGQYVAVLLLSLPHVAQASALALHPDASFGEAKLQPVTSPKGDSSPGHVPIS